jgi:hypothetical protein
MIDIELSEAKKIIQSQSPCDAAGTIALHYLNKIKIRFQEIKQKIMFNIKEVELYGTKFYGDNKDAEIEYFKNFNEGITLCITNITDTINELEQLRDKKNNNWGV